MPLVSRPTSAVRPAGIVTRARVLHLGLNALTGILSTSWLARIPAIRDQLDLTTADIGLLLLVGSLASLAFVTVTPRLVRRLGNRGVLASSGVVLGIASALMGIGPQTRSVFLLGLGLVLNGAASALSSVVLNVENARIERAMRRTVIPQFHAAFSLGAVAGSVIGALASRAGVPVGVQLTVVGAVAIVWRLTSLDAVLPPQPDELVARPVASAAAPAMATATASVAPTPAATARAESAAAKRATAATPTTATAAAPTATVRTATAATQQATAPTAGRARRRPRVAAGSPWLERRTLLVAVMLFAGVVSEGSANNWLSLAVVDGFDRPEATGGVVLGVFVGAMTVFRAIGTQVIDRFGRVAVMRASGVAGIAGLAVFGLAPSLPAAVAGVALWGVGAALVAPIGMGAAADEPLRAAGRVAVATAGGSIAQIAAPPVLGVVAGALGPRGALLLIAVPLVSLVVLAGTARRPAVAASDEAAPDERSGEAAPDERPDERPDEPAPGERSGEPAAATPSAAASAAPAPDEPSTVTHPAATPARVDARGDLVAASTAWRERR